MIHSRLSKNSRCLSRWYDIKKACSHYIWRIAEWGYYDPAERTAFLNGPTLEELTKKLCEKVGAVIEA